MAKPFAKLIDPWYPSAALGLERGVASAVQLDRNRIRRLATISLEDSLIQPSFDTVNIDDPGELVNAIRELSASAGLLKQKKWSISLPEASVRTTIVTLESSPGSGAELEEILQWKIERTFSATLDELTTTRQKLAADAQGRDRYLVVAARTTILDEYEGVFSFLGWRTGLLQPRHMGESRWLTMNGFTGDSLLLSATRGGFTAVVYRGKEPLIFRSINCEPEECEDELYRLLLFYRDRRAADGGGTLSRLLVLGEGFPKNRVSEIASETLGTQLRALVPGDFGLEIPGREISFDTIAAPAGLATLSWQ